MRLDKYLKVSRLIKRRTLAKEVSDQGRISINQRPAKASSEVKQGDILDIEFARTSLQVRVLTLKESAKKSEATEMFEVISEHKKQDRTEEFWN